MLAKKLADLYSREAMKLEDEIAKFFGKYGKNNVIEYRQLLNKLNNKDRELLFRNFDEFVEKYPDYKHLVPVRGSIYKLDRLQGLEYSIRMQQVKLGIIEKEEVTKHLSETFEMGYRETARVLSMPVDTNAAKKFVDYDWSGNGTFSDSIWKNKNKLTNYLMTDFKNGVIRGQSFKKLAEDMSKKFVERSQSDITRLVMTEGTYVANEAMITPFEENGDFEEYEFVSILDKSTSDICRGLDGQKFKMSDRRIGVNFPPMHPWCRSTFNMVLPKSWG